MSVVEQLQNQSWNRRLYDGCKSTDDLRVSTGPGRYQLDAPPKYCNAAYVPEPTIRQQKWGASMNNNYIKTDVESDLFNINRPNSKAVCNQYNPTNNKVNSAGVQPVKEESFPQTFSRLVDPPCNLRSSGWNRWEWLCQNPQEGAMMPFDNLVTTRLQQKDQFRPCIPQPKQQETVMPVPSNNKAGSPYDGADVGVLGEFQASYQRATASFPRGEDVLPAAPTALYGIQPAPINPPDLNLAPHGVLPKL
jgi:hypothetical protein